MNKTASGLLKLLYPGSESVIPDEDLEWAVRIAMEARRRVKEQQKRIGAAEFRNTHFSYVLGEDGVEKFVSTPELQIENSIGNSYAEQNLYARSAQLVGIKIHDITNLLSSSRAKRPVRRP